MPGKTYRTMGGALADPASQLHKFVYEEAPAAMAHNPTTQEEWADYFAFLRDFPGHSTESWRAYRSAQRAGEEV